MLVVEYQDIFLNTYAIDRDIGNLPHLPLAIDLSDIAPNSIMNQQPLSNSGRKYGTYSHGGGNGHSSSGTYTNGSGGYAAVRISHNPKADTTTPTPPRTKA